MKFSRFFVTVCLLFLIQPVFAEPMTMGGFEFENPLGTPQLTELSRDAWSAHWPGDAPYKEASTELIVVSLDSDAVTMIIEGGGDVFEMALSTYMGLSSEPEQINKTLFFGETSARLVYSSGIPRKHQASVFSKTLEDGSFVLVGVRDFGGNNETGKLIQSIGNTFRKAGE